MIGPRAVRIDLSGLGNIRLHALGEGQGVHLAQFGVVFNNGGVGAMTKYDTRPFGAGFPARGVVCGVEIIHKACQPACRWPSRRSIAELLQEAGRQRREQRTPPGSARFAHPRIEQGR